MDGRDTLNVDGYGADDALALSLALATQGRACHRLTDKVVHLIGRKLQDRLGDFVGISGATLGHALQNGAKQGSGRIFEEGRWTIHHASFGRQERSGKCIGVVAVDQLVKDRPRHRTDECGIEEEILSWPKVRLEEFSTLVVDDGLSTGSKYLGHQVMHGNGLTRSLRTERQYARHGRSGGEHNLGKRVPAGASPTRAHNSVELLVVHKVGGPTNALTLLISFAVVHQVPPCPQVSGYAQEDAKDAQDVELGTGRSPRRKQPPYLGSRQKRNVPAVFGHCSDDQSVSAATSQVPLSCNA